MRVASAGALLIALATAPAEAQLGRWLERFGPGQPSLSDTRIADGLREALRVGTDTTVNLTGRLDGYFANEATRILLPEQVRRLEQPLRLVGHGPQVDEFVLSMNRAAERAAPLAREIFVDAIGRMTFEDARQIWSGPDDAATRYFQRTTSERLTAAFRPVIDRTLDEVGVTRQYRALVARVEQIPFARAESLDLGRYVTDRGLAGLFYVLADQERKIRTDPSARVTELLRDVFGRR